MKANQLNIKQKRELLKAVIAGDRHTVKDFLNTGKCNIYKLDNGVFCSFISGKGFMPTEKRPKKHDLVIMYDIDFLEEINYPGTIFIKIPTKGQTIDYWHKSHMTDEEIKEKLKEYETSGSFDLYIWANEFYKLINI